MNIVWLFIISTFTLIFQVLCQSTDFGDICVQTHNTLRSKHLGTNEVTKSQTLEDRAREYATELRGADRTIVIHPIRPVPKRRRRSIGDGIVETIHLESWDGDIYYPSSNDQWLDDLNRNIKIKIGRTIHKFCCTTKPHCPKEFFHGLSFPPTPEGVVNDLYNEEEKYYEYDSGKTKTIYSHIDHFARIVWKNTTMVGCGQSTTNRDDCIFTVILYQREGAVGNPENYIENIGKRVSQGATNMKKVTRIVLVVFIIGILISLIVLIYCCRHKIGERYKKTMIDIDVLKAEQELETDSTNFWWTRPLKRQEKRVSDKLPLPAYQYSPITSQQAVDVVTPVRPPTAARPTLKNIPRPSLTPEGIQKANANQLLNRYRGMSMKRNDYEQLRRGSMDPEYDQLNVRGKSSMRTAVPVIPEARSQVLVRTPSGKSAPPPPIPTAAPTKPPSRPPPPTTTVEKPRPAPRKLPVAPVATTTSEKDVRKGPSGPSGKKPMLPSKPLPSVPKGPDVEEQKPLSVSERRKLLEQGK